MVAGDRCCSLDNKVWHFFYACVCVYLKNANKHRTLSLLLLASEIFIEQMKNTWGLLSSANQSCTRLLTHVHMDTHIDNSRATQTDAHIFPAQSVRHPLVFVFFKELLDLCWCPACYTGADITPLPCGVCGPCTYAEDKGAPEVTHTVEQRLRGHLRQSHNQANRALVVLVHSSRGKTLTILFSLLSGRMG